MPVLLIEGCDGTGKSTLADACFKLADDLPFYRARLEHYGVPKYDPDSDLSIGAQAMNQLLERVVNFDFVRDFVIFDRFHWGEPVYAPVFRPDHCVDPLFGTLVHSEFYHVENWLQSVGALTVYCTAPTEVILERVVNRGEPDLINDSGAAEKRTRQILNRYERLKAYITHENRKSPTHVETIRLLEPEDTDDVAKMLVKAAVDRAHDYYMSYAFSMKYKTTPLVESLRPKLMKADMT